jgi:predicted amidohydrolase
MEAAADAVVAMVRRAGRRKAQFLVTPEMILTGYHGAFDQRRRDALVAGRIAPACRAAKVCLILGAGSYRDVRGRSSRRPFIQATVIGPDGVIRGAYSKTVPTGGDLTWCRGGNLRDLKPFVVSGLRFGVTICNDFWCTPGFTTMPDPHLAARWAARGARVIFHLINSGHGRSYLDFHTTRMEERGRLAGVWVVSANAISSPGRAVNAPSGILGPDGRWRVRAKLQGERLVDGPIGV